VLRSVKLFCSILLLALFGLFSCNRAYSPKRRGYFKVDFPPHQYQRFDRPDFPYTFEYPVYSNIVRDSSYFDTVPENPYWINVDFPRFGARIYVSYKQIGPGGSAKQPYNTFDKLRNDAYKMTFKHTYKASSIEDSIIRTPYVSGVFFKVGGNAATPAQFFLTDSTHHFLRGALYFETTPNEDSLRHVNLFLQEDIAHLINTFQWKYPAGTLLPLPAGAGMATQAAKNPHSRPPK
jgi:gliding motility-associated lipoprotein GldD